MGRTNPGDLMNLAAIVTVKALDEGGTVVQSQKNESAGP